MFIRNGEAIDDDDGLLGDSAFQFGYSIYSTILIVDRKPVWLPQHLNRLADSIGFLQWPELDKAGLRKLIRTLAKKNVTAKARMRVQLSVDGVLSKRPGLNTTLSIQSILDDNTGPLKLWGGSGLFLPTTRLGLPGYLKWSQNAVNIMVRRKAVAEGYDDGILYTPDGKVSETSFGNLCWFKGGVLYYPGDECWPLDGLSKRHILELAETLKVKTVAGVFELADIKKADEVYLTSAIQLMRPVTHLDEQEFITNPDGPGTKLRRLLYSSVGLKL